VSFEPVRSISETELALPSRRPAVYLAWAMWLSGDASLGPAGDAAEAAWSQGSWKDRFLAGLAIPSVGEQATSAERAGAAAVSPVIRGEPQLFAQSLPLLDRTDVPEAPGGDVTRDDLSALHNDIREAWAALVASFPPAEQAKNESVFNAGFDAFRRGDLARIQQWFADDAVLTVPGRTPYSGTYRGLPEILALLTLASDRLGIDSPNLTDLVPDGDTLLATFTTTVHRGGDSHEVRFTQRCWFNDDGQIARASLVFDNEDELDAFFGTAP
jgi:ketosteroid isomerase-like protein